MLIARLSSDIWNIDTTLGAKCDLRWVDDSEIKRMLDLVSQKQAVGLDVRADVTPLQRLER